MTNARGGVHNFIFDSLGRLTKDQEPDGSAKTLVRSGREIAHVILNGVAMVTAGYQVTVPHVQVGDVASHMGPLRRAVSASPCAQIYFALGGANLNLNGGPTTWKRRANNVDLSSWLDCVAFSQYQQREECNERQNRLATRFRTGN
jgi:hypothetical protein